MTDNSKIHELPNMPNPRNPGLGIFFEKSAVKSRRITYKGGRRLACAKRFEYWRTTEGYSLQEVATKLEQIARESSAKRGFGLIVEFPERYMYDHICELENGRFKPPAWLIILLMKAYGISFPWWEFWDG